MVHGADERDFIHDLREARQSVVDLNAIGAAGHRLVRPANAFGRVRFHVEHVEVARPAELVEEDHRLRARLRALPFRPFLGAQQTGHGQTEQTEPADLQEMPAREAGFVKTATSEGMFLFPHVSICGFIFATQIPSSSTLPKPGLRAIGACLLIFPTGSRLCSIPFRSANESARSSKAPPPVRGLIFPTRAIS